ncbi:hypothetical protein L861_05565 [Litchfieldella anticariensis FP35 = DSM 16096]|uniref:Uncharacterized protein n=1 Tax=Litchfieldella anticariensis (strain DSM 16096 / CECT 5854 / CIP 108499 / LMG 22089 / FP35) TaxID=1121939 RepID=S2KKB5_LITA3|nr:hypothetical protein [Halomonas anticariensis]EPC00868.1 hypothetical protein L861_05565 [Halomonas anticariensis FP35 = DSM 16096]
MAKKHSEKLPQPTPGQPHRAGDTERIGTSKVTYLAPLPLPTGLSPLSPVDFSQVIGEMNDVYLDYGAGPPTVFGYQLAIWGPLFFIFFCLVLAPLLLIAVMDWEFYQIFLGTAIFGGGTFSLLAWIAMRRNHRDRLNAVPIRFHRQRREVCFIVKERRLGREVDEAVIVPWESLMAWAVEGYGATQYGTTRQYGLGIGYAHPETGKWLKTEGLTAGMALSLGEWEVLRAYMEYELNSLDEVQDPLGLRAPGDPPHQGAHTIRNERRKLHEGLREAPSLWRYLHASWWYFHYVITLGPLPGYLAEREHRIIQQRRPQLKLANVEEWSKPLPKAQWAKPSTELVKLSAEVRRIRQRDPLRPIEEIFAEAYRRQGVV